MEERSIMLHIKNVAEIKKIIPYLKHGEFSPKNGTRFVLSTFTPDDIITCVRAGLFYIDKVTKDLCTVLGNDSHYLAECMILHVNAHGNIIPVVTIKTFEGPDKYGFLQTHNYTNIN